MKTILAYVSTLDGKVTKWYDPHVKTWSSQEDKNYFKKLWNDNRIVIMGSTTYDVEPIKPLPTHQLIIMTKEPEKYKSCEVTGQLEFLNDTPANLIKRFTKEKHEHILIAGGAHIATSFLKEHLIDELWLTIEPRIFGTGGSFVTDEKLDINLQLLSYERINKRGTLLAKYSVIKTKI